jgi:hypothetical protein
MRTHRVVRSAGAAAAAGVLALGAYVLTAWARYGHVHPDRRPRDELLDRFLPRPDVDEYHHILVHAPAPLTYQVAKDMDLMSSFLVRSLFWLRAVPTLLRGKPFRPDGPRGLVAETLGIGRGLLAEDPGRQIVIGAYTQPWHQEVTFHALPPEEFAAFAEPGQVKIVWTLHVELLGPTECRFVTRTRAVGTDLQARRLFRRYWAPMSTGIILIRYLAMPMVKHQAERRTVGHASGHADQLHQDPGP